MPRPVHFEFDAEDPERAVRGVGWLAYCLDTEGNLFGLMERDAAAR